MSTYPSSYARTARILAVASLALLLAACDDGFKGSVSSDTLDFTQPAWPRGPAPTPPALWQGSFVCRDRRPAECRGNFPTISEADARRQGWKP